MGCRKVTCLFIMARSTQPGGFSPDTRDHQCLELGRLLLEARRGPPQPNLMHSVCGDEEDDPRSVVGEASLKPFYPSPSLPLTPLPTSLPLTSSTPPRLQSFPFSKVFRCWKWSHCNRLLIFYEAYQDHVFPNLLYSEHQKPIN